MAARGVEATLELGAGKVLSGLAKRTLPGATGVALGTPEEIDATSTPRTGADPGRAAERCSICPAGRRW